MATRTQAARTTAVKAGKAANDARTNPYVQRFVEDPELRENVREAIGTIVRQTSPEPPVYLVELLFSFKGVKRVEVPEERVHPA